MVELLSAHHDKDDSRTDEPMSREAILRQLKARVDDRWNETRVTRAMKRVFCLPRAGAAGFRQYKAICDRGGIRPFLAKRVRDGKLLDLEDLQRDLGDGTGRRSRRSDADREDSDQDEDDIVDTEQYLYNGSRVVEIW